MLMLHLSKVIMWARLFLQRDRNCEERSDEAI